MQTPNSLLGNRGIQPINNTTRTQHLVFKINDVSGFKVGQKLVIEDVNEEQSTITLARIVL